MAREGTGQRIQHLIGDGRWLRDYGRRQRRSSDCATSWQLKRLRSTRSAACCRSCDKKRLWLVLLLLRFLACEPVNIIMMTDPINLPRPPSTRLSDRRLAGDFGVLLFLLYTHTHPHTHTRAQTDAGTAGTENDLLCFCWVSWFVCSWKPPKTTKIYKYRENTNS